MPTGILTSRKDATFVTDSVDLGIVPKLDARLRAFVAEKEGVAVGNASGVYLVLERCHRCAVHHALTTRHDEWQYEGLCNRLLGHFQTEIPTLMGTAELLCELDPELRNLGMDPTIGQDVWHTSSRVGAFEVYALTPPLNSVSGGALEFIPASPPKAEPSTETAGSSWSPWSKSSASTDVDAGSSGASLQLPCGYTATLLHSKLGSNTWPNVNGVVNRLREMMPKCVVTIRLLEADGVAVEKFQVQIRDVTHEPRRSVPEEPKPYERAVAATQSQVGYASDGLLQVRCVPTRTVLELAVSYEFMRTKVVKSTVSELRTSVRLGADIYFWLWVVEVPGGLTVFASHRAATLQPGVTRIPPNAKPLVGEVELDASDGQAGERLAVEGSVMLDFTGFDPGGDTSETALAFKALRAVHVPGYAAGKVLNKTKTVDMTEFRGMECMEIASLASPHVILRVVVPGTGQPLPDVQVSVPPESQDARTDENGSCIVALRPGGHTVMLKHSSVATGWVEREVEIASMMPRITLELTLNLRIWRAPLCARDVLGWDIWLAPETWTPPRSSWEPFSGPLLWCPGRAGVERRLVAEEGHVEIEGGRAMPATDEDDETAKSCLADAGRCPLEDVVLQPPFALELGRTFADTDSGTGGGGGARLPFSPRLLGTIAEPERLGWPAEPLPASTAAPFPAVVATISVRAGCCGFGVQGVQAAFAGRDGEVTDENGDCVIALPPSPARGPGLQRFLMSLTHPAFPAGEVRFSVCPPAVDRDANEFSPRRTGRRVGLLLFMPAEVFLCTSLMKGGTEGGARASAIGPRTLLVTSTFAAVPADSELFSGSLLDAKGCELRQPQLPDGVAERSTALPLRPAPLKDRDLCPVARLATARASQPSNQWARKDGGPLANCECGLVELFRHGGSLPLGTLTPVITVVCLDGEVLSIPLERCHTAGLVAKHLSERDRGAEASLAREDGDGVLRLLQPEDAVSVGDRMQVLARLCIRVVLGHSDVGIPNARVVPTAGLKVFPEQGVTGPSGEVVLLAAGGAGRAIASLLVKHPLLGSTRALQARVAINEPVFQLSVSIPTWLRVFRLVPSEHSELPTTASVWLCCVPPEGDADPADEWMVPEHALPVSGTVKVRIPAAEVGFSAQSPRAVEHVVHVGYSSFPLSTELVEAAAAEIADGDPARCVGGALPADGVALCCEWEGLAWEPAAEWLLDTRGAWRQLLREPLCAGHFWPPIVIRCHDLGGALRGVTTKRLPATTHHTAGKLHAAVAEMVGCDVSDLAIFRDEALLSEHDLVLPWEAVDVWQSVTLRICVVTGCCVLGVEGVVVSVGEDYLMNGLPRGAKAPADSDGGPVRCRRDRKSLTGADGRCSIVVNAGAHAVHLSHSVMDSCVVDGDWVTMRGGLMSQISAKGKNVTLEVSLGLPLRLYRMPLAHDGQATVCLCRSPGCKPQGARPIGGLLRAKDGTTIAAAADLDGGRAFVLPWARCNSDAGQPCPLADLEVEVDESEGLVWCQEGEKDAAASGPRCWHLLLAAAGALGIATVGSLRPAFVVDCDDGARLRLRVESFSTIGALRAHLASHFGDVASDVGIFGDTGAPLEDAAPVYANMSLVAGILAPVQLRVVVPEAPPGFEADDGARDADSLDDVVVEVDGCKYGPTDSKGILHARARVGDRKFCLKHPCFGPSGRIVNVRVGDVDCNETVVIVDVCLYIYATEPEPDPDGEEEGAMPLAESTIVWVSGHHDAVPPEAIGVTGRATCCTLSGQIVSMDLSADAGPADFLVLSGAAAAEAADMGGAPYCSVSSFNILAERKGSRWRPKDPSPLAEREEELGAGEYLRLLQGCPVAVGFLDPLLWVRHAGDAGPPLELAARDYSTHEELAEAVSSHFGIHEDLAFFVGGVLLDENDRVEAGAEVEFREIVPLPVRIMTGCCGEPLQDAKVLLDGAEVGTTNAQGFCQLQVVVGEHAIGLSHPICGASGHAPQRLSVGVDPPPDELLLEAGARLFVYVTDPEVEEEEEAPEEEEDEPYVDPSCVWLASDPSHVPDEALPLACCAACSLEDGDDTAAPLEAELGAEAVSPFFFGLSQARVEERARCALRSLHLHGVARDGFQWCPKDPSPLEERVDELGGCELLRLSACPVVLGFLKPAS